MRSSFVYAQSFILVSGYSITGFECESSRPMTHLVPYNINILLVAIRGKGKDVKLSALILGWCPFVLRLGRQVEVVTGLGPECRNIRILCDRLRLRNLQS